MCECVCVSVCECDHVCALWQKRITWGAQGFRVCVRACAWSVLCCTGSLCGSYKGDNEFLFCIVSVRD